MILGGGDVLAAAETGSGKTGAFGLPILQVVHESIRSRQEGGTSVSGYVPQDTKAFQTLHLSHSHALLLAARRSHWQLPKQMTAVLSTMQHCRRHEKEMLECVLSAEDRDALFAVSPDGEVLCFLLSSDWVYAAHQLGQQSHDVPPQSAGHTLHMQSYQPVLVP